jgi:hypothetical protein
VPCLGVRALSASRNRICRASRQPRAIRYSRLRRIRGADPPQGSSSRASTFSSCIHQKVICSRSFLSAGRAWSSPMEHSAEFDITAETIVASWWCPMHLAVVAGVLLVALVSGEGVASAANVLISINKASQEMTVRVDGLKAYVWPVSTGVKGYSTPIGSYKPLRMKREHYSGEWDNAPMPYSIFFTPRGHAIHGSHHTKQLGSRASHGCVRLAPKNAAKLYRLVRREGLKNTRIIIVGGSDPALRISKKAQKPRRVFAEAWQEQW